MADLLSGHEPPVTHDQMIRELERELAMRRLVYPRWVEDPHKRLEAGEADERVRVMQAALDLIRNVKDRQERRDNWHDRSGKV